MGNCINILDKNGKKIGQATHGLCCGFYVDDIVKRYNPEYNMFSMKDINEQLKPVYENGTDEDVLIIRIFMNDDSEFDETYFPHFEKALAKLKDGNKIHETIKMHLTAYMKVLKELGFMRTKYAGTFAAMALTKG